MSDFFATEDDYATLVNKVGASKAAQIAKQQGWSIRPNEVKFTPMMGGGTEMAGNLGTDNQDDTTENDQADSEAVGALSSMGGLGSIDLSDPKQVSKAILANTAEQKRYYDNLANQIRDRRYGPSETEKLLALSAAFFAPTKVRGFSGAMGNVMPVLQKFGELRREGEEDRLKAEQDLAEKRMKMSQGNITNALALQRLMATYNKPKGLGYDSVRGITYDTSNPRPTENFYKTPDGRTLVQWQDGYWREELPNGGYKKFERAGNSFRELGTEGAK